MIYFMDFIFLSKFRVMSRILTGIQSSGTPHLGNVLGAILPAIELSKKHESFFFIADLHALTTIKNKDELVLNTLNTAAAWMACGLDKKNSILYKQSDIPQVTELMWYLSCITPYPMLANAHSFKDKANKLSDVNAGLFTYPVLMAADIILYDADIIPIGKDQIQHIEITRDIAIKFNNTFGDTFIIPVSKVDDQHMIIPGTDGNKMSKSYNNYINIFSDESVLKKQIMSIVTDSKGLEEPKTPETCKIFQIYKLIASEYQIKQVEYNYKNGGYGYGHAKTELFELILEKFKIERQKFKDLINDPTELEAELKRGSQIAQEVADSVLNKVKNNLGLVRA